MPASGGNVLLRGISVRVKELETSAASPARARRRVPAVLFAGGSLFAAVLGLIAIFSGSTDHLVSPSRDQVQVSLPKHLPATPAAAEQMRPSPADMPETMPAVAPAEAASLPQTAPGGDGEIDLAQLHGRWLLNDSIRRDLTIHPDGTARMHVKLDLVSSFFYGKEMDLQLTWQVEDGVLTHVMVSGKPEENVARLVKDFGNSRSYRILSLSDKELVLQDETGDRSVHRWVALHDE